MPDDINIELDFINSSREAAKGYRVGDSTQRLNYGEPIDDINLLYDNFAKNIQQLG